MSIDTGYNTLRHVLEDYRPSGWAIEFGVYSGYSLGMIAEHMPVLGLDSFKGLPEDWREGFPKGKFSDGALSRLPAHHPNAMIVPGLFNDSLRVLWSRGMPDFGLVHIDCDLYSSTVTALSGIRHRISPGTFIVFDEYHGYYGWEEHEAKAWKEFCDRHYVEYETVASGPEELAVRITAIAGSGHMMNPKL